MTVAQLPDETLDSSSGPFTRAYSQMGQHHLLLFAFAASLYGLCYQLHGFYQQHAKKHHKQDDQMRYASPVSQTTSSPSDANREDYTASIFLPYVHDFRTESIPLVKVTIHTDEDDVDIEMPVDTGSTGLLIGAPLLPRIDQNAGTRGRQYLSSSNIVYVGRYLDLALTFHGEKGAYAQTTVPVLVVDRSWLCPWYDASKHSFDCPLGPEGQKPTERDVSQITYMGVGFGRNKNARGQRTASSYGNPFLNIHAINGEAVGPKGMKAGYIVSTKGIQLGLTEQNTRKFAFMKLERGTTQPQDARDWAMPRVQFDVDGRRSIPGYALIDTGIPQMYIRGEHGMPIAQVTVKNPKEGGSPVVHRVRNGTRIAIAFGAVEGGGMGEVVAAYSFQVGDASSSSSSSSSMAPSHVVPGRQEPPPYVNTGRNFLRGYSVAFDAVDGRLGFGPVDAFKSIL